MIVGRQLTPWQCVWPLHLPVACQHQSLEQRHAMPLWLRLAPAGSAAVHLLDWPPVAHLQSLPFHVTDNHD